MPRQTGPASDLFSSNKLCMNLTQADECRVVYAIAKIETNGMADEHTIGMGKEIKCLLVFILARQCG